MTPPRLDCSKGQGMREVVRHGETAVDSPPGETLSVPERMIVAPSAGVFNRLDGDRALHEGQPVSRGDVIGVVHSLGSATPIQSAFDGSLVAIVVFEGQRLRAGQPVAWLRVDSQVSAGLKSRDRA